jgi:DNA-directed RNA polymerase I and III subunit RPAC2
VQRKAADGPDTTNAVEALEKGLDSLMDLCDVVTEKFTDARDAFNAAEADKMSA